VKRPPGQRNPAQVGFDDADVRLRAEPPPQPIGERRVEFDRDNPGPGAGQRPGECAAASTLAAMDPGIEPPDPDESPDPSAA